ncbi:MAG: TonB-dependent receptor [Bacteroidia bacterium]|nr:TonB-dependent receptor [Bacteroidia bacterium]
MIIFYNLIHSKLNVKFYISIIVLIACSSNLLAQSIFIKDKTTHLPISNAEVTNVSRQILVYSGIDGKVELSLFSELDTLIVNANNYPELIISKADAIKYGTINLSDEIQTFNTFVISNSKVRRRRSEVSNRIITITPTQMAMQNPQTTADLLGSSGEVYIQKSQLGGGSPMIRGFATNRVLIAVDGVRMNNAIFRSGNIQNVINIDPFSLSNTEVLFGPGSNIYGSDAIGGVMNFQTLNHRYSSGNKVYFHGNIASRFSTANYEKTAHLDFALGFKKWAFVTSATFSDFDDLIMGSFGPEEYLRKNYVKRVGNTDSVFVNSNSKVQTPTAYNQINFMQKMAYKFNPRTEIVYAFHYSTTSEYSRYDRLVRPRGNTLRSAEWNYGPQLWMMNNLQFYHRSNSKFFDRLIVNMAIQNFEESRIDRDLNKATRFTTKEKVAASSINIDFVKKTNVKNTLAYGFEYVHNKVNSSGTETDINSMIESPGQSRYPNGSIWTSAAVYANYTHKLKKNMDLQGGVRYNGYTLKSNFDTSILKFPFTEANINNSAFTGSVGLTYHPENNWFIAWNFSTGFRAPNVDDIGKVFESTPGSVIVPNANLKAEYAYNTEVTISKSFGELFQIDVTPFYTRLNKALVRRSFSFNGQDSIVYKGTLSRVEAVQNSAFAEVYGFQAGFKINLPEGFSISSRLTYTKGTEELDNGSTAPLRHASPMFGVTHLFFTKDKLKCDFYAMYNSEVSFNQLAPDEQAKSYIYAIDDNGNPFSPKWLTLNFKFMYQLNSYLNLSSGVENITDIRYRPYSSGIVAPGRNFIFSLRGTF